MTFYIAQNRRLNSHLRLVVNHGRMMNRRFIIFPATFFLLSLLSVGAWLTDTHRGPLAPHVLNQIGFAPVDLLTLDLERIFTSFFVTSGPGVFLLAFFMIAFSAGAAEWRTGSLRTLLTFAGVHIATLAVLSFIALPLHWFDFSFGSLIALSRDVGPSAGYFGVLGLAVALTKDPWRRWAGAAVMLFLLAAFFTETGNDPGAEYSADLAHLIAFPLGWLSHNIHLEKRSQA